MIGKSLSHYKILEKIGEGGMGVVYRAGDSKLGRDVAIKMLPPVFVQDPERLARFQREAQVLASLNHPNIGAIFGLEELEGARALILELVEGPTLEDHIAGRALSVEEALPIALQIAEALEAAHERGVVHRDLKPANVKLTPAGKVKVLDFGLAKALESEPESASAVALTRSPTITGNLTAANVILGTAAYMAPEQARGSVVDRRADIWAFGVILFEMFSGKRLFEGETVSDTLASVLKIDPDWDKLPAGLPPRLTDLIRRCLTRDPRQRLRDIGDARITLEEIQRGEVGGSVRPEAMTPPATAGKRTWIITVGAVILTAAAAVLIGTLTRPEAPELPLRRFLIPIEDPRPGLGAGTNLALTPDGTRLAYTSEGSLWIRDLDALVPRQVPSSEGAHAVFWSPKGDWVAYLAGGQLWKALPSGGPPTKVCELPENSSGAGGGAWQPDGRIVFATGDGGLYEVSEQGGDPRTIAAPDTAAHEDDFHNPSPLPGGKGVLFVVHGQDGFGRLEALVDGKRRLLFDVPGQNVSHPVYAQGHILYHREPGTPGIWAQPFDPGSLELRGEPFLLIPDASMPTVSQDGTLAHLPEGGTRLTQLVRLDRRGAVISPIGVTQQQYPSPRVSPDGSRVAVRAEEGGNRDIWLHDIARGTKTRFTFDEDVEDYPAWSPDGRLIYYVKGDSPDALTIQVAAADGTGKPMELVPGHQPSVSDDGRFLLFERRIEGDWDLWYMPLGPDGLAAGEPVQFLAVSGSAQFWPQLSPDGRYLAYVSMESGTAEIYVKRFPSGEGKWQASVRGGYWPRWSRGGRELLYVEGFKVFAIPVEYEQQFRLGNPELLFTHEGSGVSRVFGWPDAFDILENGEQFVLIQNIQSETEASTVPGIVVVQNWTAGLGK